MGLEKANEQYDQQVILDQAAGPGGTHSAQRQGMPSKSSKRSDKNQKKKLSETQGMPQSSSQKRMITSNSSTANPNSGHNSNKFGTKLA